MANPKKGFAFEKLVFSCYNFNKQGICLPERDIIILGCENSLVMARFIFT
jgi:hypothetical protein